MWDDSFRVELKTGQIGLSGHRHEVKDEVADTCFDKTVDLLNAFLRIAYYQADLGVPDHRLLFFDHLQRASEESLDRVPTLF